MRDETVAASEISVSCCCGGENSTIAGEIHKMEHEWFRKKLKESPMFLSKVWYGILLKSGGSRCSSGAMSRRWKPRKENGKAIISKIVRGIGAPSSRDLANSLLPPWLEFHCRVFNHDVSRPPSRCKRYSVWRHSSRTAATESFKSVLLMHPPSPECPTWFTPSTWKAPLPPCEDAEG